MRLYFDTHFCQQSDFSRSFPSSIRPAEYLLTWHIGKLLLPHDKLFLPWSHGHHIILRLVSIYLQIVSFYLPFAMSPSHPERASRFPVASTARIARLSRWWHLWFLSVSPNRTKHFVFLDSINFMLRRRLCKTITPPLLCANLERFPHLCQVLCPRGTVSSLCGF